MRARSLGKRDTSRSSLRDTGFAIGSALDASARRTRLTRRWLGRCAGGPRTRLRDPSWGKPPDAFAIEKLIYLARLERGKPAAREIVDVSTVISRCASSLPPKDAAVIEISTVPNARIVADPAEVAETPRNHNAEVARYLKCAN